MITTKEYKVKVYYPNDEHPDELRFELLKISIFAYFVSNNRV